MKLLIAGTLSVLLLMGCSSAGLKRNETRTDAGATSRNLASAETAAGFFPILKKTSNYMMSAMEKSGKFEGHEGPNAEYRGLIHCSQYYTDPGNHASGVDTCELMPKRPSAPAERVQIPRRSSAWLMSTMDESGQFEGHEGPSAEYYGYVYCSQSYNDPGNHSSAVNTCVLSAKK